MIVLPDDAALVAEGAHADMPADASGRVMLITCGALAREVLALIRLNGWSMFDLECLPALLHNRPEKIAPAVRIKARAARARGYARIFVLYGDCGTGGALDTVCAEEELERIQGPHCYAFFDGAEQFEARGEDELTCFYLTDFLARQFDALVWRGLGLDRHDDLREMLFAHYEKVVYLAQTDDPALTERARHAAERLELDFERRWTGYGDLGRVMGALAAQ